MARRKELTPAQRRLAAVAAVVQFSLFALAQADLGSRTKSEVNGPKWVWRLVTLVNFAGPIAYFLRGRNDSLLAVPPGQHRA